MENHFIRRYNSFIKKTNGTSNGIKEYININNDKISIKVDKCNINSIYIIYHYFNKGNYINFKLPKELNDMILSFCGDNIELKLELECVNDFPFTPPIWKFIYVKNNLFSKNIIDIENYYKWIIENMNNDNNERDGWNILYGFEKEILRFFTRINHYESLIENY